MSVMACKVSFLRKEVLLLAQPASRSASLVV